MVKDVITVDPSFALFKTFRLMIDRGVDSVIIMERDEPTGIFTEKDILFKVFAKGADFMERVEDYMSTPLISTRSDKGLNEAAKIMMRYRIRHLPVIDDTQLVGIITNRDILRILASSSQEI